MDHYLLDDREMKRAELASKEAALLILKEEVKTLQDPEYQAKIIEEHLAEQYAEQRKKHPIDRAQESDIEKTIKEKTDSVNIALKTRKNEADRALKWRNSDRFYEKTFFPDWSDSWEQRKKKEEQFKRAQEKERERFNKSVKKEYDDKCKALNKTCVDELKRLFGELDIDINRFYKNGISKENLFRLINIMEKICSEVSNIGTIPVSYQNKIYKWTQIANDIPEDSERKNIEREETEKSALSAKLSSAKKTLTKAKSEINEAEERIHSIQSGITKIRKQIEKLESSYQQRVASISAKSDNRRQELRNDLDIRIQGIISKYEEQRREINKKIEEINEKVSLQKNNLDVLLKERSGAVDALEKAFVLSFGKKRSYREQIDSISSSVRELESEIQNNETKIAELKTTNTEKDQEYEVLDEHNKYDLAIAEVSKEETENIEKLDREITQLKSELTLKMGDLSKSEKGLVFLNNQIDAYSQSVKKIEHELKEFHVRYLVKTYGKSLGTELLIRAKNSEIKELEAEIKALNKEILALDKAEELAQKERIRQEEENRKVQIERAQEEERLRKENDERKKRIQEEMREREEEQIQISTNTDLLLHVTDIVGEFELNPEHLLLQKDVCPLGDDGKRIITNSIVRKYYTQISETPSCEQYALVFVDHNGKPISEQRLIQQKQAGEKTATSFELKAESGFDENNYYLLIFNFDSNEVICAQRYRINIAFANDFDL